MAIETDQAATAGVRRVVYTSVPVGDARRGDLDRILGQARRNNGINGVSGVLVVTPDRYVQVLEGTPEAVCFIMESIRDDSRHSDVHVLSDEVAHERAFGDWAMADLPRGQDEPAVRRQLNRLLHDAPDAVRAAFSILE